MEEETLVTRHVLRMEAIKESGILHDANCKETYTYDAPFAGLMQEHPVEEGDQAPAGDAAFSTIKPSSFRHRQV